MEVHLIPSHYLSDCNSRSFGERRLVRFHFEYEILQLFLKFLSPCSTVVRLFEIRARNGNSTKALIEILCLNTISDSLRLLRTPLLVESSLICGMLLFLQVAFRLPGISIWMCKIGLFVSTHFCPSDMLFVLCEKTARFVPKWRVKFAI